MNQQVRDVEDGVAGLITDIQRDGRAVLLDNNAVERQRQRHPLVLLDAAVVVRVEVRKVLILIQRILLDVNAGRVDVRAQNVHAALHRLLTDDEEHDILVHPRTINAVARLERFTVLDDVHQVLEALCFRLTHALRDALTLGLAVVQECHIILCEGGKLFLFVLREVFPRIFAVHSDFSFERCIFQSPGMHLLYVKSCKSATIRRISFVPFKKPGSLLNCPANERRWGVAPDPTRDAVP